MIVHCNVVLNSREWKGPVVGDMSDVDDCTFDLCVQASGREVIGISIRRVPPFVLLFPALLGPLEGLMPTTPLHSAGMRRDPEVSDPRPAGA